MKEIYNKDITIWIQDSALGATTDAMYPVVEGAIHIAYRDGVHYDAVVPLKPANEVSMGFNPALPVLENQNVTEPEGPAVIDKPPVAGTNAETQRTIGRLGIVFWNSNGWEQDRCEKIAEVALEEEADVICVMDARMHPARKEHMKGYERRLERVTGKKWKGKVVSEK